MLINKEHCVLASSRFTLLLQEMSFVKDKVKRFESLNAADHEAAPQQRQEPAAQPTQGKKFLFPGNKQPNKINRSNETITGNIIGIPQTRSKPSILSEFEANLEEVWSVRKNIHHNSTASSRPPNAIEALKQPGSTVSSSLSVPKFNQNYSRHGAPVGSSTHQTGDLPPLLHGPSNHDHLHSNAKSRRLPLHVTDTNSVELPSLVKGNSRPTGFTLTESKRKDDQRMPSNNIEDVFMSTSKRKRTFKSGSDAFKFPGDSTSHHLHFPQDRGGVLPSEQSSSYAQRMAEAHLKSAGLGQYTPKQSDYTKVEANPEEGKSTKWRKIDEGDEFSF